MILKDNNDFKNYQKELMQKNDRTKKRIKICMTGCKAYGADELKNTLSGELKSQGMNIEIVETGCQLFCSRAPVLTIEPEEIFYQQVRPEDVRKIINLTIKEGKIIDSLLYCNFKKKEEIEFFKRQKKFVLRNCGKIDPKRINHYILRDGYSAFVKVLKNIKPNEVIEEVKRSRLRGRGGAGFPTGLKWQLCRQEVLGNRQQEKTNASSLVPRAYIICNGDEGDPGAFMNRAVLEGDPHSVIEGMLIGAYAIGASEGYIYVRAEYPIAVEHLNIAVKQCEELGLLGGNILGSGFNLSIHIKEGAGAFVCGEETALIASIEGKRGMPRPRPPFPVEYGLFGKPTCINNVETLANIPNIILRGYGEYINIGTEKSGGTKVFSLAGKINNTGLLEVPFGIQLGEIIYEIGGGILKGRDFKAVQTGGPSGGCIPKQYLNLPVDYESLTQIGSIMGSGGMIVVDENTCMVELARYFLSFTQSESCGKCPPCRIGTKRMLEILTRITEGKGEPDDIEKLLELGTFVKDASLCGLGQTAPNPVLSTIKFFRDEYETHIKRKYCPAAQCKELVLAPCNNSCPGGIDVSGYIQLIREGEFVDAYNLILEAIPFPSVCGRVCYHPCETKCRRGEIDEPVGINNLKRFVSDYALKGLKFKVQSSKAKIQKDKKVAIIGSGPAGLTCAYFLAKEGYPVTLFEKEEKLGGMLRYGIPEYRLPEKILDYEIKRILSEGIKVKTKKILGRNLQLDSLLKEYPAVFLAIGCSKSQKLNIPGENLQGVYSGIEFLHKIDLGEKLNLGSKVIVLGGGNVAIDAARVARRLGNNVTICYRRTKEQMPAHIYEIEEAEKEGVKFEYLLSPIEIKKTKSGFICKFEKMVLGDYDSSGRRRPVGKNEYVEMESSSAIVAIGQIVHLKELTGNELTINNLTGETNIKGLFAGGDCATGPDMVISAIGAGKRTAKSIIKFLQGEEIIIETEKKRITSEEEYKKKEEPAEILRQNVECLPLKERLRSFEEVEKGLSLSQVIVEAKRCLQCHLER